MIKQGSHLALHNEVSFSESSTVYEKISKSFNQHEAVFQSVIIYFFVGRTPSQSHLTDYLARTGSFPGYNCKYSLLVS
jgi:hypothetical protein